MSKIQPLSARLKIQLEKTRCWYPACPVELDDLALVRVNYFGFDDKTHQGTLIVNKRIATEVAAIFAELLREKFPVEKIIPAHLYGNDDEKIMADNDTSAFLCRPMVDKPNIFSMHSYGLAIDINPLLNPYVKKDLVLPPEGKKYLDRTNMQKGMIVKDSSIYKIFIRHGWRWGGDWKKLKDYHHFEKDIN